MKIAVIAPTEIPSRRANTIQIMKMCQAFVELGHDLRLAAPRALTAPAPEAFAAQWQDLTPGSSSNPSYWDGLAYHYGLRETQPFEIVWLPARSNLRRYDYGWRSVRWARGWQADLLYTRLPQAAAAASQLGLATLFEVHDLPQGQAGRVLFRLFLAGRGVRRLITITQALANDLHDQFAAPAPAFDPQSITLVAPDGVDLARYADLPDPTEARQRLQPALPERFTVGYTGHLYAGRGISLLLELAAHLPGISFLVVGGEPGDVMQLKEAIQVKQLSNVYCTGFVPNAELPIYQAACEALLMPYQKQVAASSGGDIARYLSPMKVFEYLACGRVILSSNLPVLQEVLTPANAILLPPEDVEAWVEALQTVLTDPLLRARLGEQARCTAIQHTWQERARRILPEIAGRREKNVPADRPG